MHDVMKGIRILEVAEFWYVPAAGAVLADWGADVIKVEHPERGDAWRGVSSGGFSEDTKGVDFLVQQPNRGKRSVGLDIAHPKGLELLYRLVETSDVFLTSFLPEARSRLKIDIEHIRAINPNIIYARGHGQGTRGPEANEGGYDASAYFNRTGMAASLMQDGTPSPPFSRCAFGDGISGMTLAGGVSAALFHRERTGVAEVVDVSLLSTGMWVMSPDIVASKLLGIPEMPVGTRADRMNPVLNQYRTKDDRWLQLVHLQADRYWGDLCQRLGRPELAMDERFKDMASRQKNRKACIATLDAIFATRTLAEWTEAFKGMEGPWSPMQRAIDVHDDPQVIANEYIREVDGGEKGRFGLVANPVQFSETSPNLRCAPTLGEHTDDVFQAVGLTMDELIELKVAATIY